MKNKGSNVSPKEQTMSAVTWDHPAMSRASVREASVREEARPLHLTARGRRVVTALAVMLALVVGLLGGRATAASPEEGVPVDIYTVGSGETMWSIASSLTEPGADVRDTIDQLVRVNELSSSSLLAGQQLLVPVDLALFARGQIAV